MNSLAYEATIQNNYVSQQRGKLHIIHSSIQQFILKGDKPPKSSHIICTTRSMTLEDWLGALYISLRCFQVYNTPVALVAGRHWETGRCHSMLMGKQSVLFENPFTCHFRGGASVQLCSFLLDKTTSVEISRMLHCQYFKSLKTGRSYSWMHHMFDSKGV